MIYNGSMSKKSKKRTKRYHGEDAKVPTTTSEPIVHRYEAVERSAAGEWWHSHKRIVKVISYTGGGLVAFSWLLFELFQAIF